jgi:uncharacterized protein YbcC (UPF0753/DUF2309 family)
MSSSVTKKKNFNEDHVLHVLRHYLPSQGPLKDFVHHNTLHAFQDMKFYDAIFKASQIFGYQVTFSLNEYRQLYFQKRISEDILDRVIRERKGDLEAYKWKQKALNQTYDWTISQRVGKLRQEWKRLYSLDLDDLVQPLLFRILCSYLDQGIAISHFPFEQSGLLNAVRTLEQGSFVSFFKGKRARALLNDRSCTIEKLLNILVGEKKYFENYLYDQQFFHRGWSGIVATLEDRPESLFYPKNISLRDFIHLELLLEIDALDHLLGEQWQPLGLKTSIDPIDLFSDITSNEIQEVLKIWQDAFEWSYYDMVLGGMRAVVERGPLVSSPQQKSFQAIFCIDEREYSLRTYIESVDPDCETLGAPGFFGVEFYFRPAHAKFHEKLCPAPVTPRYLIKEVEKDVKHKRPKEIIYSKHSHTFVRGFVASYLLGLASLGKLFANLLRPTMSPAIADAFSHMDPKGKLTILYDGERDVVHDLQIGFTVEEMAVRVEKILRGIGLTHNFSSLVYLLGHGSSSANNPHHGAHDCGACSGRPGAVNARVFAWMANYDPVRKLLKERGISIPQGTQFLGGLHDTASDEIAFYDEEILSKENQREHEKNKILFERALDLNAKERSRRFMSINTKNSLKRIRRDIKRRSVSYFEPRPELGHGTNAVCVVGSRELTKDLFLDRRAFLNSYDYTSDPDGKILAGVIAPLPVVCGGINLEYYFSRMDNSKLGAGTKLPHNVMGLIGVSNSSDGDLRAGLPLQMIEVHDPVRLLMIVEQDPQVVLSVISATPALYEWFINEWVHLVVYDPHTRSFFRFSNGTFVPYVPLTGEVSAVEDISKVIESVSGMESNYILDATKENMSVHLLKK